MDYKHLEDGYERICTSLKFDKPGIDKTIRVIKNHSKKSKHIVFKKISKFEDLDEDFPVIRLEIPLVKKMNQKLDNIFGESAGRSCKSYIDFCWNEDPSGEGVWKLYRTGRPLCGSRYTSIVGGEETYITCPCPKEFKNTCSELINAIKQYALPGQQS